MSEFLTAFLANLASDALLAVALYFILTQPSEKKRAREVSRQALALLAAELEVNASRAVAYGPLLDQLVETLACAEYVEGRHRIVSLFPLHFTRGAWNALREGGFLPATGNPRLAYALFRMNEVAVAANNNLRKLELAVLGDTDADKDLLSRTAKKYVADLSSSIERVQALIRQTEPRVRSDSTVLIDEAHLADADIDARSSDASSSAA